MDHEMEVIPKLRPRGRAQQALPVLTAYDRKTEPDLCGLSFQKQQAHLVALLTPCDFRTHQENADVPAT